MQIFVNTVESLNSPVYSAPPCTITTQYTHITATEVYSYKTAAVSCALLTLVLHVKQMSFLGLQHQNKIVIQ